MPSPMQNKPIKDTKIRFWKTDATFLRALFKIFEVLSNYAIHFPSFHLQSRQNQLPPPSYASRRGVFSSFFFLPALHNQSQTLDSRVCQENLFSHLKAKSTQKSARITPGGLKGYFQPEKKVLQKRKFSAL